MRWVAFNKCISFIKGFKYKYEQLYTLNNEIVVEYEHPRYIIYKGFHSYSKKYKDVLAEYFGCWVKCTIPKGSVYYLNKSTQEIVSNQIIVHKPKL